mgnify:CR=1 FL=1
MKTDIDIIDHVYEIVMNCTELFEDKAEVTTGLYSTNVTRHKRNPSSKTEDIVISVLSNDDPSEVQEAYVNVNVYVNDIKVSLPNGDTTGRVEHYVDDSIRLRALCSLCSKLFALNIGSTYRITLASQRVIADEESKQHFINNRLLFQQINID